MLGDTCWWIHWVLQYYSTENQEGNRTREAVKDNRDRQRVQTGDFATWFVAKP